jgi:hypothetical protein
MTKIDFKNCVRENRCSIYLANGNKAIMAYPLSKDMALSNTRNQIMDLLFKRLNSDYEGTFKETFSNGIGGESSVMGTKIISM